ncbi:mitotic spindle assembly checkpoint protein MAD2B-like [Tigriopus californicus]|nr:mitotic spindle assembly checkpoint protein MAD2B-like [Tigriopus californicus]
MDGILLEFIECSIHQILFHRGVYPSKIFGSWQKFGVPVMISEHPWVNQFIRDHLRDWKQLPHSNDGGTWDLLITHGSVVLERYVFDMNVEGWLAPQTKDALDMICSGLLDHRFRALLLKLTSAMTNLPPIEPSLDRDGLSFTFEWHTSQSGLDFPPSHINWCLQGEPPQRSTDAGNRLIPVFHFREPHDFRLYIVH